MYDELYEKGGWTRMRLELKVARDPFNAATERQLLVAIAVIAGFLVWSFGQRLRVQIPDSKSRIPTCRSVGIWELEVGISFYRVAAVAPPPLIVIFSTVHVEQSPL